MLRPRVGLHPHVGLHPGDQGGGTVTVPTTDLSDFWVHTVDAEPYLGTSGGGVRQFDAVATVPGFLVYKRTLVRNQNAEQVLSESQFYGDVSLAGYFPIESRVTVNGNTTTVITVSTHTSGDLELPDHIVVYLQ